ncbi:MAG: hypothetical protein BGO12_22100 [Verrucomicrobia bacterium 61-8]|nr:MAG: hypothetical protein BGO12_22100 [Verrucomicrobia bacterium 61-8]
MLGSLKGMLAKSPAIPITHFSQNRYLTYPHCNGFCQSGGGLVAGQLENDGAGIWMLDLREGTVREICRFVAEDIPERPLWFDVAEKTDHMVVALKSEVLLFDLVSGHEPRSIYHARPEESLHGLPSISPGGDKVAFVSKMDGRWELYQTDVATGKTDLLCAKNWEITHPHFCPHDPEWIGFCHEGRCQEVANRIWAWHGRHAPEGACIFDQALSEGGHLQIGHERWCFHDVATLVVGFGVNPPGCGGIYEVHADDRAPRLVSVGKNDWHVNSSPDGRWAVSDTFRSHDGSGDEELIEDALVECSDIIVIDLTTGTRQFAARTRIGRAHPCHPHPTFSPDGRYIFFNESDSGRVQNRVVSVANPFTQSV